MKYDYWFANIKGLRNKDKINIRARIKTTEELYYIEETALRKLGMKEKDCDTILESIKTWDLNGEFELYLNSHCKLVTFHDETYPKRLKNIQTSPYAIYVKGELPPEEAVSVAIVGARECSCYGREMAGLFARELAQCGVPIISGMARGIDGVSQNNAIEAGGMSFAVLGSGVDICYPREYRRLYQKLQTAGGIISEQPLGMQPLPQFFPARNRIISGLADAIVVIEAKEKSGSLITADMALEQGKDVYAMPGPVNSMLSRGCHNLIKQGAQILTSPEELIEDLAIVHKTNSKKTLEMKILLESAENIVYSCLGFQPKNLGKIQAETNLKIPELMDVLIRLELKGYVMEISKNHYVKVK